MWPVMWIKVQYKTASVVTNATADSAKFLTNETIFSPAIDKGGEGGLFMFVEMKQKWMSGVAETIQDQLHEVVKKRKLK